MNVTTLLNRLAAIAVNPPAAQVIRLPGWVSRMIGRQIRKMSRANIEDYFTGQVITAYSDEPPRYTFRFASGKTIDLIPELGFAWGICKAKPTVWVHYAGGLRVCCVEWKQRGELFSLHLHVQNATGNSTIKFVPNRYGRYRMLSCPNM